jgi:purine-binding chemotaxis protein CheW
LGLLPKVQQFVVAEGLDLLLEGEVVGLGDEIRHAVLTSWVLVARCRIPGAYRSGGGSATSSCAKRLVSKKSCIALRLVVTMSIERGHVLLPPPGCTLPEGARKMEQKKKQDAELIQLVTFSIGEEEFGVDILKVQEIIRTMEITRVPKAPDFVEGVINLRGNVIPIIDLRKRFGLETRAHDKHTRIIVIEINNMIVGFVVDSVSEVLRIPANTVEPPPPVVAGLESEYISGVGKLEDRLLILLDLDRLLSGEEKDVLSQV